MRKPTVHARCKSCGKWSSTTRSETTDNYICTECRKEKEVTQQLKPKPSLFKRISDWLVKKFGDKEYWRE